MSSSWLPIAIAETHGRMSPQDFISWEYKDIIVKTALSGYRSHRAVVPIKNNNSLAKEKGITFLCILNLLKLSRKAEGIDPVKP